MPSREECEALLVSQEGSTKLVARPSRLRFGKHNMAKGALPPEDVAVGAILNFTCALSLIVRHANVGAKVDGNLRPESEKLWCRSEAIILRLELASRRRVLLFEYALSDDCSLSHLAGTYTCPATNGN